MSAQIAKLEAAPQPTFGIQKLPGNAASKPLEQIGQGKPLCVRFHRIYMGPYRRSKRLLVTSAAKNPLLDPAGVICMNLYRDDLKHHSVAEFGAGKGSTTIYYSPSATDEALEVSVQLNFDNFNDGAVEKWIDVGTEIASLPAFLGGGAGAQALVKAAGAASKLAVTVVDRLVDSDQADFNFGFRLALNDPVFETHKSGFVLLVPEAGEVDPWKGTPRAYFIPVGSTADVLGRTVYVSTEGRVHETADEKRELLGEFPYVLISVEGARYDSLKKWKPARVTAALASRFKTEPDDDMSDEVVSAFEAYSDVLVLQRIADLKKEMTDDPKKKDPERKAEYDKRIAELIEQVQDDDVRAAIKR